MCKSILLCAVFTSANFKNGFCNCTNCTNGWFY